MKLWSDEQGFTTTFFAIMMPLFLALFGLCADGSSVIYHRIALEKATDAAGLATIDAYDREAWKDGRVELREDLAVKYAAQILSSNMPKATLIAVTIPESNKSECRIETEVRVPTIFLGIFGQQYITLRTFSLAHGS